MASIRSSARSTAAVMRFPCGHSEPDESVGPRIRAAGGRAVWIPCRACNAIALVLAPAVGPRRRVRKNLTARAY
jgi:hypothetical protein